MYNSILAERTRFSFQRVSDRFGRGLASETNASASASRETTPQSLLFASGAMESMPSKQGRPALFRIHAPDAGMVKLVADFTGWEKCPFDLRLGQDGIWQVAIVLLPGRYAYRFLVDDEWQDDPECPQVEANPFGTFNAVVEVV